jgi:hypothetical protein
MDLNNRRTLFLVGTLPARGQAFPIQPWRKTLHSSILPGHRPQLLRQMPALDYWSDEVVVITQTITPYANTRLLKLPNLAGVRFSTGAN